MERNDRLRKFNRCLSKATNNYLCVIKHRRKKSDKFIDLNKTGAILRNDEKSIVFLLDEIGEETGEEKKKTTKKKKGK